MNKTAIYAVVGIVVIGGVIAYSGVGRGITTPMKDAKTQPTAPMAGSMKDLLSKGTVQCQVKSAVAGEDSQGVVYVANGKMSGQFTATIQGKTITSKMVSDGEYIYTWGDLMPQGVKIALSKAQTAQGATDKPNMYTSQVDYSCRPWSVDETKFSIPTNIKFMDVSAMMPSSVGASSTTHTKTSGSFDSAAAPAPKYDCSLCNSVPAAQRAQCKAAMHC